MKKPFFSIITPVYNRSAVLRKTIDSVLAQDFADFELLLIDDKSSDNSLEICHEIASAHACISVIALPENRGRCIARNRGIEAAKGQWICFLDSDDTYLPNHLSTLHSLIKEHTQFKAFATNQLVNGLPKKYPARYLEKPYFQIKESHLTYENPVQLNQLCYCASIRVFFPDARAPYAEDWYFTRILAHQFPICFCSEITTRLNEHDTRSMTAIDLRIFSDSNLKNAFRYLDEVDAAPALRSRIASFTYLYCSNILISGGYKKEGLKYLKGALKYTRTYISPLFYKALIKLAVR